MAKTVKKTDSREVDHWVSTDDGRHLPIDKDGNIIFGSSKKSTSKSEGKSTRKENISKRIANGDYDYEVGDSIKDLESRLESHGLKIESADRRLMKWDDEKITLYDEDGNAYQGTFNKYYDGGVEIVNIKAKKSEETKGDKALENRLNSKEDTSKSDSSKKKETSKKSKVEFKEFKPEPWMDEEEMAEALVDSKDYIGDRALYQGVKDDLKSSGYSMGTKLTVDRAELVEYDGKSRYGTVEATYTIRDNGDFYGKKGTEYTERFQVPVVKDYSDSKNTAGTKNKEKTSKYDTSRAKKNKPPIEDRFSFQVAMPHPNASIDSQMKATTKLAVSQITKQFEDSGIKLSKTGAFNGSQFFTPDKGDYVVELSRTSRGDSKNQVSFNTRIWDNSTATGKTLMKRFKGTLTNSAPTRKPASSKGNKVRQLVGNNRDMAEWKISRAYDKTSLKNIALDAGVPSSKIRTMSTEELRAMLLSMWKGK